MCAKRIIYVYKIVCFARVVFLRFGNAVDVVYKPSQLFADYPHTSPHVAHSTVL